VVDLADVTHGDGGGCWEDVQLSLEYFVEKKRRGQLGLQISNSFLQSKS
jgi:hypothetical protein